MSTSNTRATPEGPLSAIESSRDSGSKHAASDSPATTAAGAWTKVASGCVAGPVIDRRRLLTGGLALSTVACAQAGRLAAAPLAAPAETTAETAAKHTLTPAQRPVGWPVWDDSDAAGLLEVLNSGHWGRGSGKRVAEFEERWRETMRAKHCIATTSGTTALMTALGALNIGPGDEVILPPYTFVATFNVITDYFALPVFVDSDLESMQIDAQKIGQAVTQNTKLLLPVHIAGTPADLDAIGRVAQEKNLPFIEDACQAPLAVWRGQPVGTHGLGGCLSFQASKNLTAGEGGAVLTNDADFANRCYDFHTPGGGRSSGTFGRGANFRMTEFQGSILLTQLARLEAQAKQRDDNARYLSQLLSEIPGIKPAKLYDGCDRSAWHLYMFHYDPQAFGGQPRDAFLAQLRQAGVSASSGYTTLNNSKHVLALAENPHYQKIYGSDFMAAWAERNACPVNDQLCQQAVWFTQTTLLGARGDMERIAAAIDQVRRAATA